MTGKTNMEKNDYGRRTSKSLFRWSYRVLPFAQNGSFLGHHNTFLPDSNRI
jgi:hypothetical protein